MHDRNDKPEPESTTTDEQSHERCTVCRAAIDTTEWYPIRGREADGYFHLYMFCSQECFEIWENSESNDTD